MKLFFQIKINSINQSILHIYIKFLLKILNKLEVKYTIINLPTAIKRITLLKSPHVHKSSREQFEIKTYKTTFNICSNINKNLLQFLIVNKPKSLKIKIKKN